MRDVRAWLCGQHYVAQHQRPPFPLCSLPEREAVDTLEVVLHSEENGQRQEGEEQPDRVGPNSLQRGGGAHTRPIPNPLLPLSQLYSNLFTYNTTGCLS